MNFIKKLISPILLTLIVSLVCLLNYKTGTWLTGWDNLHPEFDFKMNVTRSIFSVWQEYQGLGLLAGMAHASDLPRQLFLWGMSTVIPDSFLRYFYHFLMLGVGTLGTYFFLQRFVKNQLISFLGALFYLLNLGTIQYFYVPFEPYSTFWGLFPWEMWILFKYLEKPDKKNLLLFILIHILAIPQAYVQTVFLVYLVCVTAVLGIYTLTYKTKAAIYLSSIVLGIIFCINAFWLLPNLYFTLTDVYVTQNAMNNRMNTDRFFEVNKRRGTLSDFALLREFYYDFQDYDAQEGKLDFMMKPWREHFSSPFIYIIGYAFFGICILGLFHKNKYQKYLWGFFIISMVAFLSNVILFSEINTLMRAIPIVNQMLRNPFTKFIVPAIFIFSVCFTLGISFIFSKIQNPKSQYALSVITFLLLIGYTFPVFRGHLFYKAVQVKIPAEYFNLFSYFKNIDKTARIANFPQDSYWGWASYSWGVTGSGFLWYGIEQPIMDRAFDVWSDELEQYYWELHYAVKSQDQEALNKVFAKYHIDYIIFDESYIPSDSMSTKNLIKQETLLESNPEVELVQQYDKVKVYRYDSGLKKQKNLVFHSSLPSVNQNASFMHEDPAFASLGQYYTDRKGRNGYDYPFQSLFTNRFPEEQTFNLEEEQDRFILSNPIEKGTYLLTLPSYTYNEKVIPVRIKARKENDTLYVYIEERQPVVEIGTQRLQSPNKWYEFNLSSTDDTFIVRINDKDYIILDNLSKEYKEYGKSYFVNSPFGKDIKIYGTSDARRYQLSPKNFIGTHPCSPPSGDYFYESSNDNGLLTIEGRNTTVCSPYKSTITSPFAESLVKLELDYQSSTDEFPKYCLYSDIHENCINKKDELMAGFSHETKRFTDFIEYNLEDDGQTSLNLILEPYNNPEEKNLKKIVYSNIEMTFYEMLLEEAIPSEIDPNGSSYEVSVKENTNLKITIPKQSISPSYSNILGTNRYKWNQTSYNQLFSKNYYLQYLKDEQAVRLYAKDTFVNFWVDLKEVDPTQGSIITLETRKKAGFPLILNISTIKDQMKYVYTNIDVKDEYTKQRFIVPPSNEFDKGYQVLFNNISLNDDMTVHDIKDLSIYPFPYTFLKGIALQDARVFPQLYESLPLNNYIEKWNSGHYVINGPLEKGILTLSQSYHKGWKAYAVSSESSWQKRFPFMGKGVGNHVVVNNWANGWKINENIQKGQSLVLVYWPQYLQYIGFGLLVIPFILLFLLKKHTLQH